MDNYISRLDEIDKWLFDSFGILPGACSSTENLRHATARMVAEVLWPKKDLALTWEDVENLDYLLHDVDFENGRAVSLGKEIPFDGDEGFYGEVLKRFNEERNEGH